MKYTPINLIKLILLAGTFILVAMVCFLPRTQANFKNATSVQVQTLVNDYGRPALYIYNVDGKQFLVFSNIEGGLHVEPLNP